MFGSGSRNSRIRREREYEYEREPPVERSYGRRREGFFRRKDPQRQAAGYKGALSNPNTTSAGRRRAKEELRLMGRGREAHVPLSTRIKRWFGVRSRPARYSNRQYERRPYREY